MIFYNGFNLLLDIVLVYIAYRVGKSWGYRQGADDNAPPFQEAVRPPRIDPNYDTKIIFPKILINVGGVVYNLGMKKRKTPLNKLAQATRNAHSAELFRSLMLSPHLVETPANRKGSRQANKRKAIAEHL